MTTAAEATRTLMQRLRRKVKRVLGNRVILPVVQESKPWAASVDELSQTFQQQLANLQRAAARLELAVDGLDGKVAAHDAHLAALRQTAEEVQQCLALLCEARRIDIVRLGEIVNFMYMDDLTYKMLPPELKRGSNSLFSKARNGPRGTCVDIEAFARSWNPSKDILEFLFAHFWLHNLEFVAVDVGCQYGTSAMSIARFIKSCGKANRVIAFDPGIAGRLAAQNIRNNRMDDLVSFFPMAVSDHTGYLLTYREHGRSENNRCVNRIPINDAACSVVPSTTLDDFMAAQGITSHLIVKVDTQGAEYEVCLGMQQLMQQRLVCGVLEFTPHALDSRISPVQLLEQLVQRYYLFDIGFLNEQEVGAAREVDEHQLQQFVAEVRASSDQWTDIVLIPKALVGVDRIRQAFRDYVVMHQAA